MKYKLNKIRCIKQLKNIKYDYLYLFNNVKSRSICIR